MGGYRNDLGRLRLNPCTNPVVTPPVPRATCLEASDAVRARVAAPSEPARRHWPLAVAAPMHSQSEATIAEISVAELLDGQPIGGRRRGADRFGRCCGSGGDAVVGERRRVAAAKCKLETL